MNRLVGARLDKYGSAIRRVSSEIALRPGVSHVTLGEKEVGGIGVGQKALKVYVTSKQPVPTNQLIPVQVTLEGKAAQESVSLWTDVVEIRGLGQHLRLRSGNEVKASDNEKGIATIGFRKGANGYCLTNAHVAIDFLRQHNGRRLSVSEDTTANWQDVGSVINASAIGVDRQIYEDWALIRADHPNSITHLGLFTEPPVVVERTDILRQGLGEHWFIVNGQVYRCHQMEPLVTSVDVQADGAWFEYFGVWQARMIQGSAHHGISGALICRNSSKGIVGCGQVFGGTDEGALVWAFPFGEMFKRVWNQLPD